MQKGGTGGHGDASEEEEKEVMEEETQDVSSNYC